LDTVDINVEMRRSVYAGKICADMMEKTKTDRHSDFNITYAHRKLLRWITLPKRHVEAVKVLATHGKANIDMRAGCK
jgi:hypothetical protein